MIAAVFLVMSIGMTAFASSDDAYSLTVQMQCSNGDGTRSGISGADVSIYLVSAMDLSKSEPSYIPVNDFDIGIQYGGMTAAQSNDAAKEFAAISERKGLKGIRSTADASGNVRFDHLDAGIYLVKLNQYDAKDNGYKDMEPFLVMVPASDGESGWIRDVSVMPKIAIVKTGNVTVDPPVEKIVKGNPAKDGHFEFKMTAEDIQNPMPEGSRDSEKIVSIEGAGEKEFGTCVFTEPGTYKYKISEVNTGEKGYSYDNTVYEMTCIVTEENGELILEKEVKDEDGNAADHAQFTNAYSILHFVKTGDSTIILLLLALMALSAAGAMIAQKMKRNDRI